MRNLFLIGLVLTSSALSTPAQATNDAIVSRTLDVPATVVIPQLKRELKAKGFVVVKELNILQSLEKHLSKKLGANFNRNKLEVINTLVVCQGRYANRLANVDPKLLALCPLSLSITQKDGRTTISYVRPTSTAVGGEGMKILSEVNADLQSVVQIVAGAQKKHPKSR